MRFRGGKECQKHLTVLKKVSRRSNIWQFVISASLQVPPFLSLTAETPWHASAYSALLDKLQLDTLSKSVQKDHNLVLKRSVYFENFIARKRRLKCIEDAAIVVLIYDVIRHPLLMIKCSDVFFHITRRDAWTNSFQFYRPPAPMVPFRDESSTDHWTETVDRSVQKSMYEGQFDMRES